MPKRVFEVREKVLESGEVIEEYIELELVEIIEHKPEYFENEDGFDLGRIINVMV